MTEIATIDWFVGWGTSVFSENTAIFFTQITQHFVTWVGIEEGQGILPLPTYLPTVYTCLL